MTDSVMAHVQRAQVLLQTDRISEAEKELRTVLSLAPEYSYAHGLMALCLSRRLKHDTALHEAKTAILLEPDEGLYHYFYADVLLRAKQYEEAKISIRHAISLNPYDADYFYLKAAIELETKERNAAHDSLKRALEIDPEHADSLVLLARVQAILGNTDDAEELARAAIRNRPESGDAHTSRGYSLLYAGRAKESFESFREALRLDPNSEAARSGLIEAIKIHNPFYRLLFRFFVFMSRLSAKYQWVLIIGLMVGYRILRLLLKQTPALAPVIVPLIVLYVLFCFITWLADPIIYTTLWFSRWGRLAMTLREKLVGVITVLCVTGGIACFLRGMQTDSGFFIVSAFGFGLLLLPVTKAVHSDHPTDVIVSVVISVIIAAFLVVALLLDKPPLLAFATLSLVVYMFLVNFLGIKRGAPAD
ncbi:MAG: tetratricopeptide repeat protein [Planctomycetaceae bacterium]|nr:tetratricopeptide repeat protein [Planctomycetaceae bacterium]